MDRVPLAALLEEGEARLQEAGIAGARLDAEVLLAHALGIERGALVAVAASRPGEPPAASAVSTFRELIARRARHEPVAYLTGSREFWSLDLEVGPGVLVPRPDTELVVAVSLRLLESIASPRVLDVGTGSGAIALALAVERPSAWVAATDLSAEALRIARRNARRHGVAGRVAFAQMDLAAALGGPAAAFDLVASNPPYIALHERDDLMPDVRDHEPHLALFPGPSGMEAIERLLPCAGRLLGPGGWLVLETASDRAALTAERITQADLWQDVVLHDDLAGLPRVVSARRRAQEEPP